MCSHSRLRSEVAVGKREVGRGGGVGGWNSKRSGEGSLPPTRMGKRRSRWAEFVRSCGISEGKKTPCVIHLHVFAPLNRRRRVGEALIKRTQMFKLLVYLARDVVT